MFHPATEVYRDAVENGRVHIQFPFTSSTLTVTYTRDGESKEYTLIDNGITVKQNVMYFPFKKRFYELKDSFEIHPLEKKDTGTFYFKDQDGNLAQVVRLEVVRGEHKHIRAKQRNIRVSFIVTHLCCSAFQGTFLRMFTSLFQLW